MPDKADVHLPHALRILARDIHCEDGIATQCIREAADEIERLRLTDAEREAVRFAAAAALPETERLGGVAGELCRMHAATLRGLLERLGGGE